MGTSFAPRATRLSSRKLWIAFAQGSEGRVTVDAGARRALVDGGKSLLAAGVRGVDGAFDVEAPVDESLLLLTLFRSLPGMDAVPVILLRTAQTPVPPLDGFNPHGIDLDEAHNLLLTSDFVCPVHTLNLVPGVVNGEIQARGSVRVWDYAHRTITRTIGVGAPSNPAGTINVQLIKQDPRLRAYVTGVFDGKLYLVDTQGGLPALHRVRVGRREGAVHGEAGAVAELDQVVLQLPDVVAADAPRRRHLRPGRLEARLAPAARLPVRGPGRGAQHRPRGRRGQRSNAAADA